MYMYFKCMIGISYITILVHLLHVVDEVVCCTCIQCNSNNNIIAAIDSCNND